MQVKLVHYFVEGKSFCRQPNTRAFCFYSQSYGVCKKLLACLILTTCFSNQPVASPLNPLAAQKKVTAINSAEKAKHVACQEFYEPFFSQKLPTVCDQNKTCKKQLITHICQGKSAEHCDQQKLWQPLTDFIEIPENSQLLKETSTPKHLGDSQKVLLCWHFQKK